ncbi:TPA: CoA pyrophosphatase [Streptococcus suis]|nr:CoA pyrophosphatase [Streptococcus suis]HEL1583538.1 CoA pyrophosphatase [Streptococcus suis]
MVLHIQAALKDYQPQPLGEKRSYAVFLPLVWAQNAWHILYEIRSEQISQPGEVSFPGGRIENNETASEAVIRETVEELNIQPDVIELFGEIDYLVIGQATIRCFVGCLHLDWETIQPNEEVERLFTIPLTTLMETSPVYYQLDSKVIPNQPFPFERLRGGTNYPFHHQLRAIPFYECLPENIWGMTAQFTHRFTQILKES